MASQIKTAEHLFDALRSGAEISMPMSTACVLSRQAAVLYSSKTIRELWIRQGVTKAVARALSAIPRPRKPKKKGGAR